jgi:hypothetical protein
MRLAMQPDRTALTAPWRRFTISIRIFMATVLEGAQWSGYREPHGLVAEARRRRADEVTA